MGVDRTFCNEGTSVNKVIPGSYIYAFKYHSYQDGVNYSGYKLKISSTSAKADFVDFGGELPLHTGRKVRFFIYKKSNRTAISKESHLGFRATHNSAADYGVSGSTIHWNPGEVSNFGFTTAANTGAFYQGISTTKV